MSSDSFSSTCHLVSKNITCDVNEKLLHLITRLYNKTISSEFLKGTADRGHTNQGISTMSLIVSWLVLTFLTQCWSAPQRINWTPQAILYLKGSQGHRSVLDRTSRDDAAASHSVTLNQGSDERGLSLASSILLELLQLATEEDEGNPYNYPDDQELYINYL